MRDLFGARKFGGSFIGGLVACRRSVATRHGEGKDEREGDRDNEDEFFHLFSLIEPECFGLVKS
jgi:hypothetical protein